MVAQNTQSTPLTFGELGLGKTFICFPSDGDDSGHGGFRGAHYVFIKFDEDKSVSSQTPPDNALRMRDGVPSHIPKGMQVLEVA